jgi:hypothetical protein
MCVFIFLVFMAVALCVAYIRMEDTRGALDALPELGAHSMVAQQRHPSVVRTRVT